MIANVEWDDLHDIEVNVNRSHHLIQDRIAYVGGRTLSLSYSSHDISIGMMKRYDEIILEYIKNNIDININKIFFKIFLIIWIKNHVVLEFFIFFKMIF